MRGKVTVGTSDTNCMYVLPPVLEHFREQFPEVAIVVLNKTSSEVRQLILNDAVDFGVVTLPLRQRDLIGEPLFTRRDVVICSPDHPFAHRHYIDLKTIATEPLLALERGSMSRLVMEEAFSQSGVEMNVSMNLGSVEVIKRFVEIGFGIGIVPQVAVVRETEEGNLVAIPMRRIKPREIGLVFHRSRHRSAAANALVKIMMDQLSGRRL